MKTKRLLSTIIGPIIALTIATNVVGAETINEDLLYKNAYHATQKSLTQRTQASVNEARAEIKKLPKNLKWAIGEFSKQVDTVQHPILANIVYLINQAEITLSQVDIDKAKYSIPVELNPVFRDSYSSAVDKIQQDLQVKALDLVEKAENEKTQVAVDNALVVVNDLRKASSISMVNWANVLLAKVNDIVVSEENLEGAVYYIVELGDNLTDIAAKYGTTYQAIADLNNLKDPYIIYPGQKLRVK